jgi:hypothetical protein
LRNHWDETKEENKDAIAQNTSIVWWVPNDADTSHRNQENYQREKDDSCDNWAVNVKRLFTSM